VELFILAAGLVLLAIRLLTTEPTGWKLAAVGEVAALAAITTLAYSLCDVTMRKGNLLVAGSLLSWMSVPARARKTRRWAMASSFLAAPGCAALLCLLFVSVHG
jgi:hypothetical protein